MSRRRRPKRTASIDQDPGPSIATATLIERRRIAGWGAVPPASNSHDSAMTANRHPTGVQSPISTRSPAAIPTLAGVIASHRAPGTNLAAPCMSKKPLATRRSTSRPPPGQLFGKMEKRRCTQNSLTTGEYPPGPRLETLIGGTRLLLFRVPRAQ
jgi:hypothetical protein